MATPSQKTIFDYYRAIGMIVARHSELEYLMKMFANLMINPWDKTGEVLTGDMPSKPLLEKLMSLYRHKEDDPQRIKTFETLLKRVQTCTNERNAMVHSFWFFIPLVDGDDPVRIKARSQFKGYEVDQKHVSISEIEDLACRIQQALNELSYMMFQWQIDHDTPKITDRPN